MGLRRIQKGNEKYFALNENENTTYQNLWDATEVLLRTLHALNTYWRRE
jgi:hypothetical protein